MGYGGLEVIWRGIRRDSAQPAERSDPGWANIYQGNGTLGVKRRVPFQIEINQSSVLSAFGLKTGASKF